MARFDDVNVFLAVARAGSFRRAAGQLSVTKSTVSRAIQRLEDHLGTSLFVRNRQALRLTQAGVAYRTFALEAAERLAEGERAVETLSDAVAGTIRVSTPPALGQSFVARSCADFVERHPHVTLDLVLTDHMVTFAHESFDLVIRASSRLPDSDLKVRRLGRSPIVAVATPERARALDGVTAAPMVSFLMPDGSAPVLGPGPSPVVTRMRVNDYLSLREVVLAGGAIGLISELLVAEELNTGQLVRVMTDWRLPVASYWALYPDLDPLPARLRAFLDHLLDTFERQIER